MKGLVQIIWTVVLTGVTLVAQQSASGQPQQSDVFVSGTIGYHTYRIPSLIVTRKGMLLAFCEGRKNSRSDSGDIDLLCRRSEDGGRTWSDHQVVWEDKDNTCGNPCPVVEEPSGTVWLLMTWNRGDDTEAQIKANTGKDTRRVWVARSDDDGITWSKPVEVTQTTKQPGWCWYATGPGVGIQLQKGECKGRLVIPCDHSVAGSASNPSGYNSHVIISDDHGRSWKLGGVISPQVNECQVVELADGTLSINMRNYGRLKTTRAIATSADGGLTWSKVTHDPTLVEPLCQASFIRYSWPGPGSKSRLLFSNPGSTSKRIEMTVRLSYDEGKTWPVGKLLHPGPSAYSCLAVLPDGDIACLYEMGKSHAYERIVFVRFSLNWLTGDENVIGKTSSV